MKLTLPSNKITQNARIVKIKLKRLASFSGSITTARPFIQKTQRLGTKLCVAWRLGMCC